MIPGRSVAACHDVIAVARADGNEQRIGRADPLQEAGELIANRVVNGLVEAHQIHLVDGDHEMPDAQQIGDKRMAARLRQHAVARIDQDDGEIGGGSAGRHVARVLLVARRIGDDELALRRGEIAVGDIDRDALFALGAQAVGQQRQIDVAAAAVGGRLGHARELVFVDALGIVEQAADEGALAVVDAAGGGEAEQTHA